METIKNGMDLINQMKKSYSNSGNMEHETLKTEETANSDLGAARYQYF